MVRINLRRHPRAMKRRQTKRHKSTGVPLPRPRVFHRGFGIEEGEEYADTRDLYSDDFVERLCGEYGIGEDRKDALWNFLSAAASIYFVNKVGEDRPPRAQSRKQLAEIAALARKISAKLEQLDDRASRVLWAPEMDIAIQAASDPTPTKTEHGLTIHREDISEKSYRLYYLESRDITEAVAVLASYASHAVERLPKDKRGAKPSHALSLWVWNANLFWTEQLGRSFTFASHKSEPITEAARFCLDVLAPLAPDILPSTLGTTMREVIKLERKRTRRTSVKK